MMRAQTILLDTVAGGIESFTRNVYKIKPYNSGFTGTAALFGKRYQVIAFKNITTDKLMAWSLCNYALNYNTKTQKFEYENVANQHSKV
ncbi:MAG: hypothetical protein FVQ84_08610 [Planctomycetes bacterium]|nr:hypothetical protein [Planctomycetota bacterium]